MKNSNKREEERRRFVPETALALGLLAGLGTPTLDAAEPPAAEQRSLEAIDGRHGQWLANEHLEVFVQAAPYPRIMVLRRPGGDNLLLMLDPGFRYDGIRTWFMEPHQTRLSPGPSEQPSDIETLGENHVRLVSQPDAASNLQNIMEVRLGSDGPSLQMRHGVRNVGQTPRTIASWSIAAVPAAGRLLAPVVGEKPDIEPYVFLAGTSPREALFNYGNNALAIDLKTPLSDGRQSVKIGVENRLGTVFQDRDDVLLLSHADYEPGGIYPEGGANFTSYVAQREDGSYAEIEHVGPLREVSPGETLWLDQVMSLQPPVDLPEEPRAALSRLIESYEAATRK